MPKGSAIFFAFLCLAPRALAQDGQADQQDLEAIEVPAPNEPLRAEPTEADLLFQAGRRAFDEGSYDRALDYFGRVQELTGRGDLHYHVAVCADRLGRGADALAAYERFLESGEGEAEPRRIAARRLAELREAQPDEEEEQETQAPRPRIPERRFEVLAPTLLVAVGGFLTVGGVVFAIAGITENDRLQGAPDGARWDVYAPSYDLASAAAIGAPIAIGVAVGILVAGLVWLVTGSSPPPAEEVSWGPGCVRWHF